MLTFRLDNEAWIPVVGTNGLAAEVNLADAFRGAHELAGVGGSPLEVAAITRFLLAIVHLTETPGSLAKWAELWGRRREFMQRCASYVLARADAWDLFSEKHPFGQAPGLSRTDNPAHILVYEAARKNNPVFADHSLEHTPVAYLPSALVRGLIVTNAFAGSSGGGYRSGPVAMRSVALLCGRTLDETLLLNLIVQKNPPAAFDWKEYGGAAVQSAVPVDLVRRYLWTARRVRLVSDAGVMLAPGNEMSAADRAEDPMVVMRKDSKGTAYVPLRLDVGRSLWRSAHVLLNWHEGTRRLEAVNQLHKVVTRGLVPAEHSVSMRVCAVAGDAQGPSTDLWRDEILPFGLSVISDAARFAQLQRAVSSAERAERRLQRRLWTFSRRYLGLDPNTGPKRDLKKEAETIRSFIGELVGFKKEKRGTQTVTTPLYTNFWAEVAPAGERIAVDGFGEAAWLGVLNEASQRAFALAIARLPANARRHRAEFARSSRPEKREGAAA